MALLGRLAIAAVLLAATAGCGSPAARPVGPLPRAASAWPEAFGNASHTYAAPVRGPQTAAVRWTRQLGGSVTPGPAIGADGAVLAASNAGVLHALDPATGRDRWTFDGGGAYGSDLSTTPAVLDGGTILWPGPRDQLFVLSAGGTLLWTVHLEGQPLSPTIGSGGRVYVQDAAGHLSALDVGPGGEHHLAWTLPTPGASFGSPAIGSDGTVYVTAGNTLYAVIDRGGSAAIRWRYHTVMPLEVGAAVGADGTIVLGTNEFVEEGISPAGRIRWSITTGVWSYSPAVSVAGRAYFGDNNGYLWTVDAGTGHVLHKDQGLRPAQGRTPAGVGIWTAPLVDSAGDAYVGTAAGHIEAFTSVGRALWDLDTGGIDASYPALTAGGELIVGSSTGVLYAIG